MLVSCSAGPGLLNFLNFPTIFTDCEVHNPTLLDLFLASNPRLCSTLIFPLVWNSDHF